MSRLIDEINEYFAKLDEATPEEERQYAPEGSHLWAARKFRKLDPATFEIYYDEHCECWNVRPIRKQQPDE